MGWSNKPLLDSVLATDQVAYADIHKWFSWETPSLQQTAEKSANLRRNLTLALRCGLYSDMEGYVVFYSRESGDGPKLEVSYKQDNIPPSLGGISLTPSNPTSNDKMTFSTSVNDDISGVKQVSLCYSMTNGSNWSKVAMTQSGNLYEVELPRQAEGTIIQYYFEAIDNAGNIARSTIYSSTIRSPDQSGVYLLVVIFSIVVMGTILGYLAFRRRKPSSSEKTEEKLVRDSQTDLCVDFF